MNRSSYKGQQRQRREEEILRVARQLIVEKGHPNLNMDDLAENVGISKPTLYQHFKSKEDLIAQVVLSDFSAIDTYLDQPHEGTPREQLEHIMRLIYKTRHTSTLASLGFEVFSMLRSNEIMIVHREKLLHSLGELIDKAKAQGEISTELPTMFIVRAMFCLQGTFYDHFNQRPLPYLDEGIDKVIDYAIRLFFTGITAERRD